MTVLCLTDADIDPGQLFQRCRVGEVPPEMGGVLRVKASQRGAILHPDLAGGGKLDESVSLQL
jgi:hypothetical protein